MSKPGIFISFEGIDGCGKSTQLRLLGHRLKADGREIVEAVEPGGTPIGDQIRRILLDPANHELTPRAELLLYFASRAQNVERVIRPALKAGSIVLCDRFTDSTVAYQGAGRGLGVDTVLTLDRIACCGLQPDITVLLAIDPATSIERARRRNLRTSSGETRIDEESLGFHQKVRDAYHSLATREPHRVTVVDGMGNIEAVSERVWSAVKDRV